MAIKLKRTASEISVIYTKYENNRKDGTTDLFFDVKNPKGISSSLKSIRWKSPDNATYYDATLYSSQDINTDEFPSSGKYREIKIRWDSAKDLRLLNNFTEIRLEIIFNDRSNQNGDDSSTIFPDVSVDHTLEELGRVIKPNSNDNSFLFHYLSPETIRGSKVHFLIEVDSVNTFNSANLLSYSSQDNITGFTFKDSSGVYSTFPVNGIDGDEITDVKYTNSALEGLSTGDYFFRVTPIPIQFVPSITSPMNGDVYISNTLTISGNIDYFDN